MEANEEDLEEQERIMQQIRSQNEEKLKERN